MNCAEDGCNRDRHENLNGIEFNKCPKHYLESMSELREQPQV